MGLLYFSNLANSISPKSSSISDYFTLKTPAMVRGSNGKSAQGGEGLTLSDAGVWRLNDRRGGGAVSAPPPFQAYFALFDQIFFTQPHISPRLRCPNRQITKKFLATCLTCHLLPTGSYRKRGKRRKKKRVKKDEKRKREKEEKEKEKTIK